MSWKIAHIAGVSSQRSSMQKAALDGVEVILMWGSPDLSGVQAATTPRHDVILPVTIRPIAHR